MNKEGPVIVIEDDPDDKMLLQEVYRELNYPNEIIYFEDGMMALDFLIKSEKYPFLILSDINMPKLNGLELRLKLRVDANLHLKCIPYLFFTTAGNLKTVVEAYSTSVQGFFIKPHTYNDLKSRIEMIMEYWKHCSAPNDFNV